MSYNVTGWAIKKLDAFTLPYKDVLEMTDYTARQQDGIYTFNAFEVEGMEIIGTLENDRIIVSDLSYSGEYSGTYWDIGFEPILLKSTGTMRARVVWEGGDAVEVVTVENGVISREDL